MPVSFGVKAIVPKKFLEKSVFVDEYTKVLRNEAQPAIKAFFRETVRTWDTPRPRFTGRLVRKVDSLAMIVKPTSPAKKVRIYNWVDLGTRAHTIAARRSTMLIYRAGYVAKTRPRLLSSRRSRSFGRLMFKRSIQHPGIKARKFSETIAKVFEKPFQRMVQGATRRAVLRGGLLRL